MASSEVELCNAALDLIGSSVISSIEDDSKAGRLCKRNYGRVRDLTLRAYPWNCATRRATLPALGTAPAWGFARAFQLPQGPDEPEPYCLRVIRHQDELVRDVVYRIEGRRILTDEAAPFPILYVARLTDPAQFDPLLDDAISARLAADISYAMTNNATLGEQLYKLARDKVAEARRIDAQEGTAESFSANSWLEARG